MNGTGEGRSWRRRLPWLYRQSLILLLVILFAISLLLPRILVFIEAGEAGVLFRRLAGGVAPTPLGEGLRLKYPWDSVTNYDLRLQSATEGHSLMTRDGLQMNAEVTFRYRPCRESLPRLHQGIGPTYLSKLLVPEVGAMLRQVAALCAPEQVFSTERGDIENAVLQELRLTFSPTAAAGADACAAPSDVGLTEVARAPATATEAAGGAPGEPDDPSLKGFRELALERAHAEARAKLPSSFAEIVVRADVIATDSAGLELLPFAEDREEVCGVPLRQILDGFRERTQDFGKGLFFVQDLLVRTVVLPPRLRLAIEQKLQEQQSMLGYRYRVSKELLESLRKEAEGLGVQAFQAAVGPGGIRQDYLTWHGVAATLGLATSPNAKVVVVGGGKDGLPLILNADSLPTAPPPPTGSPADSPEPPSPTPVDSAPGPPGAPPVP